MISSDENSISNSGSDEEETEKTEKLSEVQSELVDKLSSKKSKKEEELAPQLKMQTENKPSVESYRSPGVLKSQASFNFSKQRSKKWSSPYPRESITDLASLQSFKHLELKSNDPKQDESINSS